MTLTLTLHPRARMLAAGLALIALSLGGALLTLTPATAMDGAGGDLEEEELEITETAVYAHPYTDAAPPTATESVPPQVVCIVFPDLCPPAMQPISDAGGTAIDAVQDNAPTSPAQPIPPDTVAAAYFGGQERYQSVIKFDLPRVPEGEEVVTFRVSLPMEDPSYDMNSPGFREFVTSVMVAIGDGDPGVVAERFGDAVEAGAIDTDGDLVAMEACPLTEPFEPSEAPQTQDHEDMPREEPADGEELGPIAADCMLGGTGRFDEDSEAWVFDLAFAVDEWLSGELDNHGVLISPIGAPNLAYGDPDLTTNAQITLGIEDVTVAMDTAEPPPEVGELDQPGEMGAPQESENMSMGDGGSTPGGGATGGTTDSPSVADGAGADEPMDEPAESGSAEPQVAEDEGQLGTAEPARGEATPAWYAWLLVPGFAGGAFMVGNALTASPLAAGGGGAGGAGGGGGAMSRLIASRGGSPA